MALTAYLGFFAAVAYALAFLLLEPRLSGNMRIRFRLLIEVTMVSLLLYLALNAHWTWNLTNDLLYVRVNGGVDTARVSTYLMIPLAFFFTWYWGRDEWRALATALFMAAIHEAFWEIYYYGAYYVQFNIAGHELGFFAFIALLASFLFVYVAKYRRYHLTRTILAAWLFQLVWFIHGFYVTVSVATPSLWVYLDTTRWYSDFWVNLTEFCSWVLVLMACLVDVAFTERVVGVKGGRGGIRRRINLIRGRTTTSQ